MATSRDHSEPIVTPLGLEQAFQTAEARFRILFEHAPMGIVLADAQSFYVDVNPTACEMFGYTHDEFVGLHASDIVAHVEIEHVPEALSEIHGRADHHREWQFRRKDGSVFSAEVV